MKKIRGIILFLVLICVGAAVFCGGVSAEETKTFVDDVGREITLPATIDAVSPSGPLAQIVLYSFNPDLLVSISSKYSADQEKYIDARVLALPVTGQFYGSKSTMNAEEIMELNKKLHIDVVLDVGEAKSTMKTDLDNMQATTGVPFAFVTQNKLNDIPQSYLTLGTLLGNETRGKELSTYVSDLLKEFDTGMAKVGTNKVSMIYVTGVDGNSVHLIGSGENSYHGEVINYLADNLAGPAVTGSGLGDEYTMEDILSMNPDYIIVAYTADHAYYNDILNGEMWQSLSAVKNGNVYEAPYGPYSWMGGPPSVQRLLSMIWLGNLFYPDVFNYNVEDNVKEFYSLFFRYDLSDSDYDQLTIYAKNDSSANSTQTPVPLAGILVGLCAASVFAIAKRR
ncbi:MAG: ABC transporter substrate-binding protein [Methanocorpusculum sp.]|uniref:ABC transporter substrate-binding protein n=1 Tax=Methanocorpusculum sp. TaxID=2058474 RepID=UPI00271FDE54|nr:ABC transporter substrate-binding protein [Methanocorpusculum sp.]MDO9522818.1 ABC transporter substrate-binding protein [Methanocorpusculum sp.]